MVTFFVVVIGASCEVKSGEDSAVECVECSEESLPNEDLTVEESKDSYAGEDLTAEESEDSSAGEDLVVEYTDDSFSCEDLSVEYDEDNSPIVDCNECSFPATGDRCSQADHDDFIVCRRNSCLGCEPTCFCHEDLIWSCDYTCIDPMPPDSDTDGCDFGTPPRCRVSCDS
jgi:hypothetical protein